jgi:hypothetical protein
MVWKMPNTDDLSEVVSRAQTSLLVCSPFITASGVDALSQAVATTLQSVEIWTKFDARDWLTGASDPDALLEFLEGLPAVIQKRIRVSPRLHTKLILADESIALAGSANLTAGGLGRNIELIRTVSLPETAELVTYVTRTRPSLDPATFQNLRDFVTQCQRQTKDREALLDLIREVTPPTVLPRGPLIPLSRFIDYTLSLQGFLPSEVRKIYSNEDHNNRTGHLKQGYYAAQRFLQENRHFIEPISRSPLQRPFDFDQTLLDSWQTFLQQFGSESDQSYGYDFDILRGILTPLYGGRRIGGGGGDYPFKLVWPILARLMTIP